MYLLEVLILLPLREFDVAGLELSKRYKSGLVKSIVVTSVDKTLKVIDYQTGEVRSSRIVNSAFADTAQVDKIISPHKAAILSFAFHPTQPRYLVTGSMDGTSVI